MICSMTAFGRTQVEDAGYSITIEVRTLNSRYLDIVLRLPKNYLEFEDTLRRQISQSMRRGRIEVFVQIETTIVEQKAPKIDQSVARFYWEQLQELHRRLPGTDPPTRAHLMINPHIYQSREAAVDRDILKELLTGSLTEALRQIQDMRCHEGDALLQDCMTRLEILRSELSLVEGRKGTIIEDYQKRMRERVEELLSTKDLDESRLLQEVAYMAERADINEEIVRFQSHIEQMESLLKGTKPADGRRLDFLTQELHREANTIGCKTGDLDTVQAIVRIKSEIGKLKEQVQNIE
ncbi:MAG: YicC family protein [Desulfobacteraceae bacterium]|nr:YicC family protein [Desulfobacteraceae bacterium]